MLENGCRLKEGKFAGDGDGRGSQPGDCAGGESPKNGAGGFSAELASRKWLAGEEPDSCGFTNANAPSPYPELSPCGGRTEEGSDRRSDMDIGGRLESFIEL